jgi:zinc protease
VPPSKNPSAPHDRYRVERFVLSNGLRVVVSPDRTAPIISVTVAYDVGTRSEPPGRTGFAHLFEHLMFQGSISLDKLVHAKLVQGAGGTFNGSTHLDYTEYSETMPSNTLERTLFLEADRMRGLRLTERNLLNQIDVVKEEIRVKVLNRPYGGFPSLKLPAVLYETFANAHDGYGSFGDLEAARVPDAMAFFDRYYACGNAVLSVAGDIDPDRASRLIERHFGEVPTRPAPPRPDAIEPPLAAERHRSYVDPLAPLPAFASAWRLPDPIADLGGYLAYAVLAGVLADGDASRLVERLVRTDRMATRVRRQLGFMDEPFTVREPTALLLEAHLPAGGDAEKVLATIDEELARVASDGLVRGECNRARARLVANLLGETAPVSTRAMHMAVLELQRGDPALINDLPDLIASVSEEKVRAAAGTLLPERRATVEVVPGSGQPT